MAFLRNLLFRRFHSLFNPKTPHTLLNNHTATRHSLNFKFPHRPIASLPQTQPPIPQTAQNKKPLSTLFIEEMSGKTTTTDKEEEEEESEGGDTKLKKELRQLTEEVRHFKEKAERKSLYAAFTNKPVTANSVRNQKVMKKLKEPVVFKELSPDMVMFVKYLYEKGYFKDTNFAKGKESFDLDWFQTTFARNYIKFATHRFATDNQEIAKWLSGSALKQVAVFGCPSIDRSIVFPAKILRKFFEVPENTVCSKCKLRESCKFSNQSVWNCDTNKLDLEIVMKVITSYALHLVHPELVVSDEVNKSVSQLLKEVCSKCKLRESCKFSNQSVWNCDTNKLDLEIVMKVITSYALHLVHPELVVSDEVNKSVSQLLKEVVKLSQTT